MDKNIFNEENLRVDGVTNMQLVLSSLVGSSMTAITMTPLDVVKIRLQAQLKPIASSSLHIYRTGIMDFLCECNYCRIPSTMQYPNNQLKFTSAFDAMIKIVRMEGIRSLWSGFFPTLFISLPTTVIYFPLYDRVKHHLGYDPTNNLTQHVPAIAGCACRAITSTLFSPLELFRTKMQAEKLTLKELKEIAKVSLEIRGPKFLLRGLAPALLREVPFSGIYWYLYEFFKNKFQQDRLKHFGLFGIFISGAISGSIAGIVTLPFDVIKTHRQIELGVAMRDKSMMTLSLPRSLLNLYQSRGITALFAGAVPRLMKVMPSCAIMITCYEYGKIFFRNYNNHL